MRRCRGAEPLLETPGAFDSGADWAQIKGDEIRADLRHPRQSAGVSRRCSTDIGATREWSHLSPGRSGRLRPVAERDRRRAPASSGSPASPGTTTPRSPPTTSTAAAATRTRARRSSPTSATTGPGSTSLPATKRSSGGCRSASISCRNGGHLAGPRVVLVHGTPTLNTVYWTEDRPDEFCLKMASHAGMKAGDVIAFGHTHKPWHREVRASTS